MRWRQTNFGLDGRTTCRRDDPNYSAEDRRSFGQIRGETRLFDGAWTTGLRAAVTEDRRRYTNLPDPSAASTRDAYRGTRTSLDWGNTVRLPRLGAFRQGALGFGVTHAARRPQPQRRRRLPDPGERPAAHHRRLCLAAVPRLRPARPDRRAAPGRTTGFTDATTWRVGAVLAVPEVTSRLRVSAGSGYAAPSLYQRFGVHRLLPRQPGPQAGTPLGWEIGAETDIAGRHRASTPSGTFFQSRVQDLINFNTRGSAAW